MVMYFCPMASKKIITIIKQEYDELKQQNAYLTHQLAELKRQIFRSKRERFISNVDPQYGSLLEPPET